MEDVTLFNSLEILTHHFTEDYLPLPCIKCGKESCWQSHHSSNSPDESYSNPEGFVGLSGGKGGHDGLVPLHREGQKGEHAHTDSQGGGEGVDAAVDGAKNPISE